MRQQGWTVLAVGAAAVCVGMALPAAGWANPTWLTPSSLSQGGHEALFVDAAMGSGGGAAVAWQREDESSYGRAQVAVRAPFGSFGSALTLSPASHNAEFPQVAVDAAGDATVVWENESTSPESIEAATVVDGIPSSPVTVSETTSGHNAIYPVVAMDERGDTAVAWTQSNGSDNIAEVAFRPAGGSFGAPVALSTSGENAEYPRVAIDAAGEATVVWYRNDGSENVIEESTGSGGSFSAAKAISGVSENGDYPVVAMNAEGDTAVSWENGTGIAEVAIRSAGGPFDAPVSLSESGGGAEYPQVALDGHGDPTVAWSRNDAVQVRSGTVAGAFPTAPITIATPARYATVAEDPAGDTLVGYNSTAEGSTASAAFRPAGGLFTTPQVASPSGQEVSTSQVGAELGLNVAMDAQGDGLFGYRSENGVYLAGENLLDAAGPILNGLSIPASTTVGAPVTFSVSPVDQLSGVAGTSWSFGDGATASGGSVTHAFANQGIYTVSVTSTDGVGNSTTRTGTIRVAAASTTAPAPSQLAFNPAHLGTATATADSHGRVQLKVVCPSGGAACAGTVTLTLRTTASSHSRRGKRRIVHVTITAGHASFSVAAGASRSVTITLSAKVAKLLAQHHTLKLAAVVATRDAGHSASKSSTVLVKAPAKSKKPGKKKKK